jgi:hypothetical protein
MNTQRTYVFALALVAMVGLCSHSLAADWVVEENGVSPNFATIQDAVNAAAAGDRIFVVNKTGSIPYQENVTIDKPLELLPHAANGSFLVMGTYTISPNGANFSAMNHSVRIIGMSNTSGSINATSNNSTGHGIEISVLGCQLNSGSINISGTNYYSRVSGNWLAFGNITVREALVSGNLINGIITINDASGSMIGGDETLYVVGNRITTNTGSPVNGYLQWNNNDHYFHIANNWLHSRSLLGVVIVGAIKTGAGSNDVVNNSVQLNRAGATHGVNVTASLSVGTRLKVENNALHDVLSSEPAYAVNFNSGIPSGALVEVNYNVEEGFDAGMTNATTALAVVVGNTNAPGTFAINQVSGVCSTAEAINAGHPGAAYTDHDLSRNDRGVTGGSLNYNNFWPILTGGARVMMVKTPRVALPSSTINAEADAHDR